jgi:nucleoside-diphosphate-sugar epimerase
MASFMKSKHVVPLVGGGKQPVQIISVNDLSNAVDKSLSSPVTGVLTIAHPHVYTYKEFYKELAKHLRTRIIFVPIPFFVLLSAARVLDALHLPLSISYDSILGLKKLESTDTAKDLAVLGLKPNDLKESLNESDINEKD